MYFACDFLLNISFQPICVSIYLCLFAPHIEVELNTLISPYYIKYMPEFLLVRYFETGSKQ